MFQTFKNAWKVPDLKKKLLFTLLIVLLYRIGAAIPVPFVNTDVIASAGNFYEGNIFQFVNWLSGGAFAQGTLFALSVTPYITASIVMQLLTIAIPALERISKDGEEGKKKIAMITRWVTIGLALITAWGYVRLLGSYGMLLLNKSSNVAMYYFGSAVMILCLTAGASLIMWLAEKINEKGIGNGISIILFANIVARVPNYLIDTIPSICKFMTQGLAEQKVLANILNVVIYIAVVAVIIVAFGFVVWFTGSERRIPIQYAKRVVGRKMYGGQSSSLPLKMNMSGVMPIIFANSIVALPATIAAFFTNIKADSWWYWLKDICDQMTDVLSYSSPLYLVIFVALIIAFSFFYITISFNPVEVANNIRNNGGSIPGIRPGKPTVDYIKKILSRVTLIGGLFLCVVSGLPLLVVVISNFFVSQADAVTMVDQKFLSALSELAFSGSSLLIVVGVALETVRELEAQITLRNYKGFLD